MGVLIVGTVALDSIKTPFGEKQSILGGSAVHSSIAASFYSSVKIAAVVGEDFPQEHIDFLAEKNIDTAGLQRTKGETFRWQGYYEYDMNQAHTLATHLNVLADFKPYLPADYRESPYVFLANMSPRLQLEVINKLVRPKLVVADTMNFWIQNEREALHEVVRKVDCMLMNEGEARMFMETPSLPVAAKRLLEHGAKSVIIKKGEHGALLFSQNNFFAAPSYPQEQLTDPTGAGDSFAGGFIGYLAKTNDLSSENIRRAVIVGSVMASFNVEDFSLDRMRRLKHKEIVERFDEFKKFSHFDPLSLSHWI